MPDGSVFLGDRLLRRAEVEEMVALSTATLYRMIKDGEFPSPVKIGTGTVRWRLSEIQGWLAALQTSALGACAAGPAPTAAQSAPRRRGRPPKGLH